MQIIFDRPTIDRAVERANAIQVRRGLYTWAKYFCQLVFLEIGSKLNLYVQYSKIEIYLEIWGFDNLNGPCRRPRARRAGRARARGGAAPRAPAGGTV